MKVNKYAKYNIFLSADSKRITSAQTPRSIALRTEKRQTYTRAEKVRVDTSGKRTINIQVSPQISP